MIVINGQISGSGNFAPRKNSPKKIAFFLEGPTFSEVMSVDASEGLP
jgi:hypothetical protein